VKNRLLAQLDRRLDRRGDIVTLLRNTGTGANIVGVSVDLPAMVKGLTAQQLIGNVSQQTYFIIISPTHIVRKQWPGGNAVAGTASQIITSDSDARMPVTTDKLYVRFAQRAISRVVPVFDAGQCVRIEMTVTG
jgi:hypothetical protein